MKKLLFASLLWAASTALFGQTKDSVNLLFAKAKPDTLILNYFQATDSGTRQVIVLSTISSVNGFNSIRDTYPGKDTVGKLYTDTIVTGIPTGPRQVWIQIWLINGTDTVGKNKTGNTTIPVIAKKPAIKYLGIPYNNKTTVHATVHIKTNDTATLKVRSVFKAEDTLSNLPWRAKEWIINPDTNLVLVDSSYGSAAPIYQQYAIINKAGTAYTNWAYIPESQKEAKPFLDSDSVGEPNTTTLEIGGWVQTMGLDTKIKVTCTSGDTSTTVIVYGANGISKWKSVLTGLTPGKLYTYSTTGENSKGKTKTPSYTHRMGTAPTVESLGPVTVLKNGYNITIQAAHSLPDGVNATVIGEYDTDPNFGFPKALTKSVTGSGTLSFDFSDLAPGTYYAGITQIGRDSILRRTTVFHIFTLGVKNAEQPLIKIYPNPACNFVNISLPEGIEKYEIVNVLGETVYQGNERHLDIGFLNSGTYSISSEVGTTKLIVIK